MKTKVYISAHKPYSSKVQNGELYTIVRGEQPIEITNAGNIDQIAEDNELTPLTRCYSELSQMYEVYLRHIQDQDCIGFCHYRRYWSFYDQAPKFDQLFQKYKIILPQQVEVGNLLYQYAHYHNERDLIKMYDIVLATNEDYAEAIQKALESKYLNAWNMSIMPVETFKQWVEFAIPVLQQFASVRGWKTDEDVRQYVKTNAKLYHTTADNETAINYQSRVFGFLFERLFTCWIYKNFDPEDICTIRVDQFYNM